MSNLKEDFHNFYLKIAPYLNGGGSGGGGGHTIEDSTGTALTQRDTMQFSDSFAPSDDSTNAVTKIELNKLTSGEMDDIVTPLPSVQPRYHRYSTDEQVVGEWIDGSLIYEKTYTITASNGTTIAIPSNNKIINVFGFAEESSVACFPLSYYYSASNFISIWMNYLSNELTINMAQHSNVAVSVTVQYIKVSS